MKFYTQKYTLAITPDDHPIVTTAKVSLVNNVLGVELDYSDDSKVNHSMDLAPLVADAAGVPFTVFSLQYNGDVTNLKRKLGTSGNAADFFRNTNSGLLAAFTLANPADPSTFNIILSVHDQAEVQLSGDLTLTGNVISFIEPFNY